MKLTLEQLRAWTLEASREPGFDPIENIEEELAGIPDEELMAALFVCAKAAAWAREQALEEAAKKCDAADKSAHPADLADAIRALKEPSNG